MGTSEVCISYRDVEQFVRNGLEQHAEAKWDIDGLTAELVAAYPEIVGVHAGLPVGSKGSVAAWIDQNADYDRFRVAVNRWQMTYEDGNGKIVDLRDLSASELEELYREAIEVDDFGLVQSIRACRGEPPLVRQEIGRRNEDGTWRCIDTWGDWETGDYELPVYRLTDELPVYRLTVELNEYLDNSFEDCAGVFKANADDVNGCGVAYADDVDGEWALEAYDVDGKVLLAGSDVIVTRVETRHEDDPWHVVATGEEATDDDESTWRVITAWRTTNDRGETQNWRIVATRSEILAGVSR